MAGGITQYDFYGVISVWLFGAVCAGLAWRTNSLLPGLVLHAMTNLLLLGLSHYEFYLPL